ncbi:glycosyl hydrolase family 28-related protein [uncultured Tateyamaria sp.]|uniref:glycosyl hydrolase family 28-related protein n=1 Tax=uncultured Tateyamaria sp. TaxID=455651 RepID=UPI002634C7D9|nr:glycosyl hydrolase family 28-related protein [uncultured Tateyamaria sp.]
MNKAITDGVLLMPPAFANGLDVWSSGDGTPGSDTYLNAANAAFTPADQDFGGCLELQKTETFTRVRYMGETPLLPGCYLRVTARIKAISGSLPEVRISGYAARGDGSEVTGVTTNANVRTLTSYGEVVEVSAIVGAGNRGGVDMVWGSEPVYGHFGITLSGPNGGIVRLDDIEIEDITSVFLRDIVSSVDVRDFGAVGDGVTDDSDAFDAANAAAAGRTILVPAGTFRLEKDVALDHQVKFEGQIDMPVDKMFLLRKSFDLPTYIEAFGDEGVAFRKAFQALLNSSDHDSLDLGGRRVQVDGPIDMQAAVPNRDQFNTRRVIRNGQIEAVGDNWDTVVTTSQATYSTSNTRTLTNVTNAANIEVGSLVEGNGVGREIYVREVNVAAQEITLNAPIFDAVGTQNYTFRRFQYLVDLSGFSKLSKFNMSSIEFQCNGKCSGIMLAPAGPTFELQECFISRPLDRGLTSIGGGCQGILIDRCQFLSTEESETVDQRTSIGLNVNSNDAKIRDCRATQFRHFICAAGQNHLIMGNHFFQGDGVSGGIRTAGIVLQDNFTASVISGNYVDNCFIEWTNERDPTPQFTAGFSFSSFSLTDNVFLASDVADWFSYLVVKPHGSGHFLNGVSVTGNRFRCINGTMTRAERVDTSFADLNHDRNRSVYFEGNSYHNVEEQASNPLLVAHDQNTNAKIWTIDTNKQLPFESFCQFVDSVALTGDIRNTSNARVYENPVGKGRVGANEDQFTLEFASTVRGQIRAMVRMDKD